MATDKDNSISRALIETFVRKKLAELKKDPGRSARSLVDMALNFSEGRFQKQFFSIAQTMLQNEDSGYYRLIRDMVTHVDSERLLTFGLTLGYNSFTAGAKKIRANEAARGYNIPWTIMACESTDDRHAMSGLIRQGIDLGINAYILFATNDPKNLISLADEFPDCAFVLLFKARDGSTELIDLAEKRHNLMPAVELDTTHEESMIAAQTLCDTMRRRHMLYSVYLHYREDPMDLQAIDGLIRTASLLHPAFTLLLPEIIPDTSDNPAYEQIVAVRNRQEYCTVPFDLWHDSRKIDAIISDDACAVAFDADGNFQRGFNAEANEDCNYHNMKLDAILHRCCRKK